MTKRLTRLQAPRRPIRRLWAADLVTCITTVAGFGTLFIEKVWPHIEKLFS